MGSLFSKEETPPPSPSTFPTTQPHRPPKWIPGPVKDLEATVVPTKPSIALKWRPPSTSSLCDCGDVDSPEVDFLIRVSEVGPSGTLVSLRRLKWDPYNMSKPITTTYTKSDLEPLKRYSFEVVVENKSHHVQGERRRVHQLFDWHCRYPGCCQSRIRRSHNDIYDFCSGEHKKAFDDKYCSYPQCTNVKNVGNNTKSKRNAPVHMLYEFTLFYLMSMFRAVGTNRLVSLALIPFCYHHIGLETPSVSKVILGLINFYVFLVLVLVLLITYRLVKDVDLLVHREVICGTPLKCHFCVEHKDTFSGECTQNLYMQHIRGHSDSVLSMGYFIHVKPSSEEYKKIKQKFEGCWCSKKGRCPTVQLILSVVNPTVEKAFYDYKDSLPSSYVHSEMYFHGTRLSCHIDKYQSPCSNVDCSVCAIAKHGFHKKYIRRCRYQRFGQGFYFAPNSSKSSCYCCKSGSGDTTNYDAMLLCEVAPGKKHFLRHSLTTLQGPPSGCHSVYGKSKFLFFNGDLNYDEIVIFESKAICPRYVLLFS